MIITNINLNHCISVKFTFYSIVYLAERKGFEPLKAVTPWRFSRPLVSTSSRIFPSGGGTTCRSQLSRVRAERTSRCAIPLYLYNGGSYPIRTDGPFLVTGFQDQLIKPTLTNFHWLQMRESNTAISWL